MAVKIRATEESQGSIVVALLEEAGELQDEILIRPSVDDGVTINFVDQRNSQVQTTLRFATADACAAFARLLDVYAGAGTQIRKALSETT